MVSEQRTKIPKKFMIILVALLLLGPVFAGRKAEGASLSELVSKAKQEGALNATVISSLTGKTTQQLAAAFHSLTETP